MMSDAITDSASTSVPRLLLISGATGTGKTTIAKAVAHEANFARIVSTDTIREVMRISGGQEEQRPALHRSSYSQGEIGDAVTDWIDTAEAVGPGVEAVIAKARREGVDLIIEGVHIIPNSRIVNDWNAAGGAAVGVVVKIEDETTHRERIKQREATTWRGVDRYLNSFDRIRAIQRSIVERGNGAEWKTVDTRLHTDGLGMVRQWLNEAWYAASRRR
jgi:2-phosphoglycerate kinase